MATEIKVGFTLEGKDNASDSFEKVSKAANETKKSMTDTITAVSVGFLAVKAAIEKVSSVVSNAVNMTLDSQRAQEKLAFAVKLSGKMAEGATERLQEYVDEMESLSAASDTALSQIAATNVAFGLSENQTKALMEASIALNKVTGQDVVGANKALLQTLNGEAGEIKALIPEVASLTKAQLQSGAAIDLVRGKIGQFVSADGGTLSGLFARIGVDWDNLVKDFASGGLKIAEQAGVFSGIQAALRETSRIFRSTFAAISAIDWSKVSTNLLAVGSATASAILAVKGFQILSTASSATKSLADTISLLKNLASRYRDLAQSAGLASVKLLTVVAAFAAGHLIAENFSLIMNKIEQAWVRLILSLEGFRRKWLEIQLAVGMAPKTGKMKLPTLEEYDAQMAAGKQRLEELQKDADGQSFSWGILGDVFGGLGGIIDSFTSKYQEMGKTIESADFGKRTAKMTAEQMQQREQMLRQMDAKIASLRSQSQDQYVTGYEQALSELKNTEQDAARAGINVSAKAAQLKSEIVKAYAKSASEYYRDLVASEEDAARISYERNIAHAKEALDARLLSEGQYQATVKALAQTYDADKQKRAAELEGKLANVAGNRIGVLRAGLATELADYRVMLSRRQISAVQFAEIERQLRRKNSDEVANTYLEAEISAVQSAGLTTRAIELEAQKQVNVQRKAMEEGLINATQFAEARAEIERKAAQQKAQTTGNAKTDDQLTKATGLIGAAKSGVSSIISNVGSMFGPMGTMIAEVVNLVTMAPDQFKKMLDGLIEGIKALPQNLLTNIPQMISSIVGAIPGILSELLPMAMTGISRLILDSLSAVFATLPTLISKMIDFNFWLEIAKSAFTALVKAFKNFWSILFTGKSLYNEVTQATRPKAATFNPNLSENEGGNEFKVKEYEAGKGTAQTVEDQVTQTVEEGGKGFFQYIQDAWKWVVDNIFKPFYEGVKAVFSFVGDLLTKIGSAISEGMSKTWTFLNESVFKPILAGFDAVGGMLGKVFETAVSGLKNVANFFSTVGSNIWNGFKAAFDAGVSIFSNAGSSIWNAVKAGFDGIGNLFKKIFSLDGAWGKGTVEGVLGIDIPFLRFASGGVVPGNAILSGDSKRNDVVPAMLSPGEFVIPRSIAQSSAFQEMLKAIGMPGYAHGGFVGVQKRSHLQYLSDGTWNIKKVGEYSKAIGETAGNIFQKANPLPTSLEGSFGLNQLRPMFELIGNFVEYFGQLIGWIETTVRKLINFLWETITQKKQKVFEEKSWIEQVSTSVGKFVRNDIVDVLSFTVKDVFRDFFNNMFAKNAFSYGGLVPTMQAAGVPQFNQGGFVPGSGTRDTVPALLTPGEYVLSRAQVQTLQNGGSSTIQVIVNVSPHADITERQVKETVVPAIVDELQRLSQNGRRIISAKGVY